MDLSPILIVPVILWKIVKGTFLASVKLIAWMISNIFVVIGLMFLALIVLAFLGL